MPYHILLILPGTQSLQNFSLRILSVRTTDTKNAANDPPEIFLPGSHCFENLKHFQKQLPEHLPSDAFCSISLQLLLHIF